MTRVCSDLLHAFFSLQKDYNKKRRNPFVGMNRFPLSKNTSQRKYPNIMIRIFNLFCKLNEIKISDQEWFEKTFEKTNLLGLVCPYCNSKERMIPHDMYSRYMITIKGNRIESVLLRIPRVKCTSCGHTHAVLPEMLIPYSSCSLRFVLTVLKDYFLHVHTVEQICKIYQIAHSTLYAFRDLFLSHKKLILGVLNDALEQEVEFIAEMDGQFLFRFWKSFRFSFLQADHATDFHHL